MNLFDLVDSEKLKPHQIEALAWLQTHIDNQTWGTFKQLWQGKAYLKVTGSSSQQELPPFSLERPESEGEAWRS